MQGNSLIKTFAILFGIVCIYQLSFTFISSGLERKAEKAAISKISDSEVEYIVKRSRVEVNYLDSIGDLPVLLYSSYNDAKTKENETPRIPYIGPKIIIPSAVSMTIIAVAISGFLLFSDPKNLDL